MRCVKLSVFSQKKQKIFIFLEKCEEIYWHISEMVLYSAFPLTALLSSVFADGSTLDYRLANWPLAFLQKVLLNGVTACPDKIHTAMCDWKYHCKYYVIFAAIFWMCSTFYLVFHLPKTSLFFIAMRSPTTAILQQGGF